MRNQTFCFIAVGAALLCGCSTGHFKSGRGDVGQFILHNAIARGGSPVTNTNALPSITGPWRYSEDEYGVVIRMAQEQYPAVQDFLRQAFGEPKMETNKFGVYRLSAKGGAIQFLDDGKQTQIIVLRPMSTQEIFHSVIEATKEMEKSR